MTITLEPEQEEAIQAAIRSGAFRSVDEFIDAAIAILANSSAQPLARPPGSARGRFSKACKVTNARRRLTFYPARSSRWSASCNSILR